MYAHPTNYVYHLYGEDEVFFREFSYSLKTLVKHTDPANSRIVVYTDDPSKFRRMPVVCESIAEELEGMKGPHRFGYRVKLCCILKCAASFPGNILYLDCDTVIRRRLAGLVARLKPGHALMYHQEKLAGRFPQFDGFETLLPDGARYRYGAESWMFNAGVIGLHPDDAKILNNALVICDALLQQGRKAHICEQFAVSEAFRLAGVTLGETCKEIAHYYRTSAKRYMHEKIQRLAVASAGELWSTGQMIPYSYPRVQIHKLTRKFFP